MQRAADARYGSERPYAAIGTPSLQQARQAGQKWGEDLRREGGGALPSCSVVYCSPFSRTVETARLAGNLPMSSLLPMQAC